MVDKTSYTQCLTHMIKGNLGAGMLAMPASFAHTGLVGAVLGLPFLCIISAYCVHLLIGSAEKVEDKTKGQKFSQEEVNYAKLARGAFELAPKRLQGLGHFVGRSVDTCLLVTQIGVCCVYIIFVVDNITSILASYRILVPKTMVFLAIFPVTLMLSFIRTLSRLTFASLLANILQSLGLALIVEFLLRDFSSVELRDRDNFRPISEMALGFGSAMFAFEGISVVLPLYSRMRRPQLMSTHLGVINVSFLFILVLYFLMGILGYLKYGHGVRDSITLNLPSTPLYDGVKALFTASILLSYPLQFYVPNEIIWNWAKKNLIKPSRKGRQCESDHSCLGRQNKINPLVVVPPGTKLPETLDRSQELTLTVSDGVGTQTDAQSASGSAIVGAGAITVSSAPESSGDHYNGPPTDKLDGNLAKFTVPEVATTTENANSKKVSTTKERKFHFTENGINCTADKNDRQKDDEFEWPLRYEYYCRLMIVILTFTLAMSVPKLNLLMDLIGSFSGAALCLTIPAVIHLAAFWKDTKGLKKASMIIIDGALIIGSISAGLGGSLSSLVMIMRTFNKNTV